MNKLLAKQLKKYIGHSLDEDESFQQLINSINNSYNAYERDRELSSHAFRIAEEEYLQVNERLKKEVLLKKESLAELKEAVSELGGTVDRNNDDLSGVITYIREQILSRQKAELSLSKTAHRLSTFIINLHSGILVEDENRDIVLSNQSFCRLFNIPVEPEQLIGLNCVAAMQNALPAFADPNQFQERVQQLISEKKIAVNDEVILADGRILERDYIPIFNADEYNGHLWMYRDITERRKSEQEFKRLSLMASANSHGVVFTNDQGRILWTNNGFCNLSAYSEEEIIGKTPIELLKGEHTDPDTIQKMLELFYNGRHFNVELLCYRKDGTTFWGRAAGQSVLSKDGKVEQFFALVEDVTVEREAKLKLVEAERRFRTALDKIGDNVWEHNFKTGVTSFPANSHQILGLDASDDQNNETLWWDHTHPEDRHLLEETDRLYRTGKKDHHALEYRLIDVNGNIRWVLDRGAVLEKDATNRPLLVVGTHADITERKLAEQSLKIAEEKYRSIIANMNLGLLEVDLEEKILFANQSFSEMSGYLEEELLGQKASSLFLRGANIEAMQNKHELRKSGISDAYEVAVKNKRGQLRWWLISGAPRYNDRQELIGSIGIHLDITSQKNLEYELIEAREQAEESARAKELFLANMSHEIRTPMNAIIGMTQQLRKTSLNENQKLFVETVASAGEHLLVVINDILDISKIEAGKMMIELIPFDMKHLMEKALTVISMKAKEKAIKLVQLADPLLEHVLVGDPFRVSQILINLLSNAIKFTEEGSITLQCEVLESNEQEQKLKISVADTGIGMSREFQSHLFEKFKQADESVSRKYGGTGLGMVICKQLTELMDGSIDVLSIPGKGTRVSLTIPFAIGKLEELKTAKDSKKRIHTLKGKRILLAEDNELNVLVATAVLNNYEPDVTIVNNGAEAVAMLQKEDFDVVLMDMQMPVMDGLEATRRIRQFNATVPIIALTANAVKGESEKCIAAGMNDYISKPYAEEQLVRMIAAHSNDREADEEYPVVPVEEVLVPEELYNLSQLNEISRNNMEFVIKIVGIFIEHVPAAVENIREAINKGDYATMRSIAHRIKPSIDNLKITSLHQTIRDLEAATGEDTQLIEAAISKTEKVIAEVTSELKKFLAQQCSQADKVDS